MEAPMCRLCSKRHWGTCEFVTTPTPPSMVANNDEMVANTDPLVANSKHGVYADKDKRRAYQREYMRQRRAR